MVDLYNSTSPAFGKNGSYGDLMYVAETERIIAEHDTSKPLFFYHAFQVNHAPMEVP